MPTHRIFCTAILLIFTFPLSTLALHGSFPVYRHPQTLGRVEFLMKTLSQRPESGLDSSPCAAMSGPQVRTPLDVVGVRFRVPARKRRLQAVMRGKNTPYDTKGFRGSWLHACKPCPFRSRHVSMVCGEWHTPAVTFEVSAYQAHCNPLPCIAADTNQRYDQSYS